MGLTAYDSWPFQSTAQTLTIIIAVLTYMHVNKYCFKYNCREVFPYDSVGQESIDTPPQTYIGQDVDFAPPTVGRLDCFPLQFANGVGGHEIIAGLVDCTIIKDFTILFNKIYSSKNTYTFEIPETKLQHRGRSLKN